MKVSLITTVRNEAASIDELIASVRSQSRKPDEWIVVDAGSSDGTAERLRRSDSCRVISEPGNIAHGRNVAIAQTQGEIIAVTDAGCRLDPDWLARLIAPIEAGEAEAAGGCTRPRIQVPFDAVQWALLDQFAAFGLRSPSLSSRSLAFSRRLWVVHPYPEWLDIGEDRWMLDAWRHRGVSIVFVESAVVEWEMRPTLVAFGRQHFQYMRGDGRALMRSTTNWLRATFYGGLALLAAWGGAAALVAVVVWLGYLLATSVRLADTLPRKPWAFVARALALFPVALALMDIVKLSGYAAGLVQRWNEREA